MKSVMAFYMLCKLLHLVTVYMNKTAAFFTFKVKMLITFRAVCVLIACTASFVNNEFSHSSKRAKLVKRAVNRRSADPYPLLTQMLNYITHSDMGAVFL